MIERVIRASVENRVLVLFGALLLAIAGIVAVLKTPVDALPDLSDVQVIIKTDYSGQAPEIVENEVTYPISTTMLSVPGASTVRGFSLFGTSFVYVLFEDGTDLYWARSRVLESLNSAAGKLPSGVTPDVSHFDMRPDRQIMRGFGGQIRKERFGKPAGAPGLVSQV